MVDTTQGQLSNGISLATTLNGGDDNDLFLVFQNRAVLNLNGEDDDDTFVIRTFLEEDSETQVVAGAGADRSRTSPTPRSTSTAATASTRCS